MNVRLSVAALSAVVVVPPLAASEVVAFTGKSFVDPWPSGVGSPTGRFGRSEAGEFNGDATPDVLLFDGDRPVLLIDPDQFFAPVDVPVSANDGAVLRSSNGARDRIVLVGASGLQLGSFDPLLGHVDLVTLDASIWSGAGIVRCGNLDGAGAPDVCGVAADHRTVLSVLQLGPSTFVAGPSFQALSDVVDVLPIEWDGDTNSELAVLTQTGLQICETNGILRASWNSVLPGCAIARVHKQGSPIDRVAWITAYAPPVMQSVLTVGPSGIESQLDLGALDVVAALGGDFDRDGDDDLLLSHRYSHELVWIENNSAPTSSYAPAVFDAVQSEKLLFGVGPADEHAPLNRAWPALADFDGDGDLDIVFAVERTGSVNVIRCDGVDENRQRVGVDSASYAITGGHGSLAVRVNAPLEIPAGSNRLEYVVYRRASVASELESTMVAQGQMALPATWPATITISLPESTSSFANVYDVQLRLTARDASGARTAIHPATIASFTVEAPSAAQLVGACDAEFSIPVTTGPQALTSCGFLVSSARMTHFRDDQPPVQQCLGS